MVSPDSQVTLRIHGDRLKRLRVARELTQQDLAVKAGVDSSYISHIESGRKVPSWDVLERLLRAVQANAAQRAAVIGLQELSAA